MHSARAKQPSATAKMCLYSSCYGWGIGFRFAQPIRRDLIVSGLHIVVFKECIPLWSFVSRLSPPMVCAVARPVDEAFFQQYHFASSVYPLSRTHTYIYAQLVQNDIEMYVYLCYRLQRMKIFQVVDSVNSENYSLTSHTSFMLVESGDVALVSSTTSPDNKLARASLKSRPMLKSFCNESK